MKKHHWILIALAIPAIWPAWIGIDKATICMKWRQYGAVKEEIRSELKSPSTAEFAPMGDLKWETENMIGCGYRVTGYVDAQNSYGAMLRKEFDAKVYAGKSGPTVMWTGLKDR